MRYKTLLLLMFLTAINAFAQDGRIVMQNGENTIEVKWYSQMLVYPTGVNLYRMQEGTNTWEKINATPIVKMRDVDESKKKADEELYVWVETMKNIKNEQLEGFILMNVMIKSFTSTDFSIFLGIQYNDNNIEIGKRYKYKVQRIIAGKELLLAESDYFMAESFKPIAPPTGYKAQMGNKQVEIYWNIENERFFAVNVYRKNNEQTIQLNNKPVLISQIKDSVGTYYYPEIKYRDDSIAVGQTYTYYIKGVDYFGNETQATAETEIVVIDQEAPLPPLNLSKKVEKLDVTLAWNIQYVDDLVGFYVYRSTEDNGDTSYQRVNPTPLSHIVQTYTDKVPSPGGYYYQVAAVDKAGNEARCSKIFVEVQDVFPPSKPTELTATADTGYIILRWLSAPELDVKGYLVYRKTVTNKSEGDFSLITKNMIDTNYFADKLPRNTKNQFLYKIVAMDTAWNKSDFSNIAGAHMPDTKAPVQPYLKSVNVDKDYLNIEWIPNADSDLKGYNLYRRITNDTLSTAQQVNVNLVSGGVTRFTDKWVKPGIEYQYYIIAYDSAGNESLPSKPFSAIITAGERIATSKILKFTANKKGDVIELSWELKEGEGHLGVVVYKQENKGMAKPVTGKIINNKWIDKDIKQPATYTYHIRAYQSGGDVIKSEPTTVNIEQK